ncbi:hypothetical protein A0H81_13455 [Grifola frondosa]|uniref:Uncharacterized protein n=1 Tax=Grifola frondosa TaxID=5627 RepID=A0A1C7LQM4_GRIFR|nr:hypothetical protein A0H81_13455 [Grifola frondosa]
MGAVLNLASWAGAIWLQLGLLDLYYGALCALRLKLVAYTAYNAFPSFTRELKAHRELISCENCAMDPFTATVVGSRHPVCIPVHDNATSFITPAAPTQASLTHNMAQEFTSSIRRKPLMTHKSPSAGDELHNAFHPYASPLQFATPPERVRIRNSHTPQAPNYTVSSDGKVLPLPLYHPLGRLAKTLPELDPAVFGLPNPVVAVDVLGDAHNPDPTRRSSSRPRRPAAKVRDREAANEEDRVAVQPSTGTANGRGTQDTLRDRHGSPRKRRTAGANGSSAGAKRKRREADDGDAAPPAKRTRNPRSGAASRSTPTAPSPLVSATVAASDLASETADTTTNGADAEEGDVVQVPKRSSRSKKSRTDTGNKRSNSSASEATTTSASVSAVANSRNGRSTRSEIRTRNSIKEQSSNMEKGEEEEAGGEQGKKTKKKSPQVSGEVSGNEPSSSEVQENKTQDAPSNGAGPRPRRNQNCRRNGKKGN